MLPLNLPLYKTKISTRNGKMVIYDNIRKRFVALTPEEWVRQHFVHFLIEHKDYPHTLMANEVLLNLNNMKRRCDTVLYTKTIQPQMIIEYKAPSIKITQEVFSQISLYNIALKVDYLIVSNGIDHFCCKMDYTAQSYHFLNDIPHYDML